jgi:hypothetical protein
MFNVTMEIADDYQVFVNTPWRGRDPEELARVVCAALAGPPWEWHATWHPTHHTVSTPPTIAGSSWEREQI